MQRRFSLDWRQDSQDIGINFISLSFILQEDLDISSLQALTAFVIKDNYVKSQRNQKTPILLEKTLHMTCPYLFSNHPQIIIYKMKSYLSAQKNTQSCSSDSQIHNPRKFRTEQIPALLQKIFSEFDSDKNQRFSKDEFPKVLNALIDLVGGECPHADDIEDIFNLLDVNGDETVDRQQFEAILTIFFKLLKEKQIDIEVSQQSDIIL